MARTINEIQRQIVDGLRNSHPDLSDSKVSEWRVWTYVVAVAIYSFEIILDLFRTEVNALTDRITPGTTRWYAEMCYRFQHGHELLFDEKTAMLYYAKDDPDARIIRVVAVAEGEAGLSVKVAKFDEAGKIIPLTEDERYNFAGYVDSFKFAGVETEVISTVADCIRYRLDVYYDPAVPRTTVREKVKQALDDFRISLSFDAMFYVQRLVDAVMAADGVVTVDPVSVSRQGADTEGFLPVTVMTELYSGYFNYADDCEFTLISTKQ